MESVHYFGIYFAYFITLNDPVYLWTISIELAELFDISFHHHLVFLSFCDENREYEEEKKNMVSFSLRVRLRFLLCRFALAVYVCLRSH